MTLIVYIECEQVLCSRIRNTISKKDRVNLILVKLL